MPSDRVLLTRLIARSDVVAETRTEYKYEYREAEYEYDEGREPEQSRARGGWHRVFTYGKGNSPSPVTATYCVLPTYVRQIVLKTNPYAPTTDLDTPAGNGRVTLFWNALIVVAILAFGTLPVRFLVSYYGSVSAVTILVLMHGLFSRFRQRTLCRSHWEYCWY